MYYELFILSTALVLAHSPCEVLNGALMVEMHVKMRQTLIFLQIFIHKQQGKDINHNQ